MFSQATGDSGVSEILGTLVLIGIVTGGVTLIAISIFSHPLPPQIPAVNFRFTTTGNTLTIYHMGGDPVPEGEYQVRINNQDLPAALLTKSPAAGGSWQTGETLTITQSSISPSSFVQVIYVHGGTAQAVLATNGTL